MRGPSRSWSKVAVIALTLVLGGGGARAQAKPCAETAGPTPHGAAKRLRSLDPNSKHPNLMVKTDADSRAASSVVLPVKGSAHIDTSFQAVTANVLDVPSFKDREFGSRIALTAKPTATGRAAVVRACITKPGFGWSGLWKRSFWDAGTYEGTVQVYGPRLAEFQYGLVITTKWHWIVPVTILFLVVVVFLAAELMRPETALAGATIYLAVAIGGALLTYFTQYGSVDTWGDNPGVQIPGLAVAAITAAATGRAAAVKFFSTDPA
jgi:hypothetical protein